MKVFHYLSILPLSTAFSSFPGSSFSRASSRASSRLRAIDPSAAATFAFHDLNQLGNGAIQGISDFIGPQLQNLGVSESLGLPAALSLLVGSAMVPFGMQMSKGEDESSKSSKSVNVDVDVDESLPPLSNPLSTSQFQADGTSPNGILQTYSIRTLGGKAGQMRKLLENLKEQLDLKEAVRDGVLTTVINQVRIKLGRIAWLAYWCCGKRHLRPNAY